MSAENANAEVTLSRWVLQENLPMLLQGSFAFKETYWTHFPFPPAALGKSRPPWSNGCEQMPRSSFFGSRFEGHAEKAFRAESGRKRATPLPSWTPGHRIIAMSVTRNYIRPCDDPIQCPSPWTLDQWMNPVSPISITTCDEPAPVQLWQA
jgi:hypothetical protein